MTFYFFKCFEKGVQTLVWILNSFSIIFPRDGDILKKPCRCGIVLWLAMEYASIILRLFLS